MKYTRFIIDVIEDKAKQSQFNSLNWKKILLLSSFNRILFLFAKKIHNSEIKLSKKQQADIKSIIKYGHIKLERLANTFKVLEEVSRDSKVPFLYVKTYKFIDYVTFDVDFLVPFNFFDKVLVFLSKHNIKITPHPGKQSKHQRNCFQPGLLKMDLHRHFFWQGLNHIDRDYVWTNTQEKEIAGVKVPVPSYEADFLLNMKQFAYERRFISYMDFLAVKKAYKQGLDFDNILKQVYKYKWFKSFKLLINLLSVINKQFYPDEDVLFKDTGLIVNSKTINSQFELPYHFKLKEVLTVYFEMLTKHNYFPFFDFAYYFFTTGRYYLSNKKRLPYYLHWFPFNEIGYNYKHQKCLNEIIG